MKFGRYDRYLRSYADRAQDFAQPVVIGLGMNVPRYWQVTGTCRRHGCRVSFFENWVKRPPLRMTGQYLS
jgi:hypothetical protein